MERPLGRKSEKDKLQKRKRKDRSNESLGEGSPVIALLKDFKEEKMKMNEKTIQMFVRSYCQEQVRLAQENEKMRMEQLKEEERILIMDTSRMPQLQAEYFKCRQMEILE